MPTHAWNTIANPDTSWTTDTRTHRQMKAERYQVRLKKLERFDGFALKTLWGRFSVTCTELMEWFFQTPRLFWIIKVPQTDLRTNKEKQGDKFNHWRLRRFQMFSQGGRGWTSEVPFDPWPLLSAYIVRPPHRFQTMEPSGVRDAKQPFPIIICGTHSIKKCSVFTAFSRAAVCSEAIKSEPRLFLW